MNIKVPLELEKEHEIQKIKSLNEQVKLRENFLDFSRVLFENFPRHSKRFTNFSNFSIFEENLVGEEKLIERYIDNVENSIKFIIGKFYIF
jgi:hypothetical protein